MMMRNLLAATVCVTLGAATATSQASFEQTIRDLASADANVRMRAVHLLKEAAYPEAAVPLAKGVTDPEDDIQLEAIAAELNIFLAEKIVPRKRVGLVIEVRNRIAAESAFSGGPSAVGPRLVPEEVLAALRAASRDATPRVALEALYAFGTLSPQASGAGRRDLLRTSGPDLAAMLGAPDPAIRFAAIRVLGRLFDKRPGDDQIETTVGDAVITSLNESDRGMRLAAIQTLGAMRYERGVQALTDLFQYFGRGDLAEATLDALARIGHASSVPLFTAALNGKNGALKVAAIEGLARTGDRQQLTAIQAAVAAERSDEVRLAGIFATVMLSQAPLDPLTDALLQPRLHDRVRQYLIEIAPGHVNAFARQLQDPDARMRRETVDILGLSGDRAALPLVEPLTRDRDPQVALAAGRAVARLM
jgi:HEAT repeat protein